MKRHLLMVVAVAVALPLVAQDAAPAAVPDAQKVVASVNGERITLAKLDQLWARAGAKLRKQYEKTGGKQAFLENYLRKRLLLQEAVKKNFDKRPEVQAEMDAARESALFDLYVRDVVAEDIINEDAIRKFYDEHKAQFTVPEKVHVRHILITPREKMANPRNREQAMELMSKIMTELHPYRGQPGFSARFAEAARKYSEDTGTAAQGGDLGLAEKGLYDPKFDEVAWNLTPGMMSGIVETQFGMHLIYSEGKQPATSETYEAARADIREFLMAQNASRVVESVNRLTNELRGASKISVYPENIK
ncbi:MAG: peptidyl-prolyl cis-trans isomerase [Acidobacteriota bacterium]|jgi:parvulin-like peptidyl-prolyl isomerase|nr:peptidyl-prolyl cis-trans isomerase [Acidobacteriota bacterium]